MNTYQIFSRRPSGEERLVSVTESKTAKDALEEYKKVNVIFSANSYRAVKVG